MAENAEKGHEAFFIWSFVVWYEEFYFFERAVY